ncbi:hypothetical protein B0T21DRAFT_415230 [Apiosordaria backusii]|uniref:Fungal N-terminal domain-containing protein n=1 Tax=Apiosordaria backusii TaxID=314023 RepID=A0AA40DYR8_9PEZI|nr:hypothetical protein B0T21DRAFT_415230 [Apiosordaria backusii]
MEPLSAAATVMQVAETITSVIGAAITFVRNVRSARQEIIAIKKELSSLQAVLEILADDFHNADKINFPDSVLEQVVNVAADCQNVANQIASLIRAQQGSHVSWKLSGKEDMERLREDLERHKATLSVTLDLVSVIVLKDIKHNTEDILQYTSATKDNTAQLRANTTIFNTAPITLRDIEGRRCLIPFSACRTWTEMSEAIQQLYARLPQNYDVQSGNYELIGPSGEIILPAFWESFVLPGWEMTLKT